MKANIVLDATMLDTYHSCPAKFHYRFNLNKTTTVKAQPLDRGTLVHVGFEHYFLALQERKHPYEAIGIGKQALLASACEDSDLEQIEVNQVALAFEESCQIFADEDRNNEIIAVEQPFMYLLHEDDDIRLNMIGKIDLLVNRPGYGVTPYDHKTYSRDFPVKRLTNQFCNYAYATNSNYLVVNRVGLQTSIAPIKKHKRVPLSYDPDFLEQWKQNTILIARQYVENAVENNWPMNLTSCDKFNRLCEYHEVCDSSGKEAKMWKLDSNFKTAEPWDVSAVLGRSFDKLKAANNE